MADPRELSFGIDMSMADAVGAVPTDWTSRRLKHLVRIVGGGTPSRDEPSYWNGDIPWISPKDMGPHVLLDSEDHTTAAGVRGSSTRLVPKDSVLIVVRSGVLRHSIPVAVAGRELALNQDMKALIPGPMIDPDFLTYYISAHQEDLLTLWRKEGSTVESLESDLIGNARIIVPSLPIQKAITAFLDRETARVDTLVEKKRRLLNLLDEKRTALINRAVTRGLDPDVAMKNSGLQWLGKIPAHWDVVQLRNVTRRFLDYRGLTPAKLGMQWGGEIPAISAANFRNWTVALDRGVNFGSQELLAKWMKGGRTAEGDVVITTEAPLGHVAQIPDGGEYILSQRVILLKAKPSLVRNDFLYFLFRSSAAQSRLRADATGSTAAGISQAKLAAIRVPVPPLSEQQEIANSLQGQLLRQSEIGVRIETAISLLHEYRTALIAAAVTGQIHVEPTAA